MRGYEILLGILLFASAIFYAPDAATDLNSLLLDETLTVSHQGSGIVIEGNCLSGSGTDWNAAMMDLYATAAGTVFLETTDRILIATDAKECLPEILRDCRLRPGTQLYWFQGEPGAILTEFAAAHESGATIAKCQEIPIVSVRGGGCYLEYDSGSTA